MVSSDLEGDCELFTSVVMATAGERKGRGMTGPQTGMTPLGGELQILRVVIPTAQNDEVLETTRDEQLTVIDESEIAGSEKAPFFLASNRRAERQRRIGNVIPIPGRDALAAYPNLTNSAFIAHNLRVRVDD